MTVAYIYNLRYSGVLEVLYEPKLSKAVNKESLLLWR